MNTDDRPIQVIRFVADQLGLQPHEIVSRKRKREIAEARHLICYIMKGVTNLSLGKISASVGCANHTTALHAIRNVEDGQYTYGSDWPRYQAIISEAIDLFKDKSENDKFKQNLKLIASVRKLNNLSLIEAARVYGVAN